MRISKRCEGAAARFLTALWTKVHKPEDTRRKQIIHLVGAAFHLYERAWDCHRHNIEEWQWPHTILAGDVYAWEALKTGAEPWTVLLREVFRLADGAYFRVDKE